ncbi:methyltransferase domain-containing protein [Saccharospirillum salsuginis]|uniref:tRNA 5-carboxymethoxyuridine methyltransferase n=1 Tax=Saccharospirillum salsuginis TaxID=418750 RepID=A0A918KF46_9GAMM|nr:methyltransferase domain-containing protein [Saccharospirillum salsuginis]GGX60962.1 tRNA 5-carboxymethoxyuridine methyltransferase [Saccharospirillum salsuginis]
MSYISFEHMADRFESQIYGTLKGRVRQAVLWDLYQRHWLPRASSQTRVLDAGGGLGQMSGWLLEQGLAVDYFDVSGEMVERTRELLHTGPGGERFRASRASMLDFEPGRIYDLVVIHAVLEWLSDPREALERVFDWIAPGGYLGLMVYNRHMLALRNLMRGNLDKVKDDRLGGDGRGLTPISPMVPSDVRHWLEQGGFEVTVQAGVRSFTDLTDPVVLSWYDEADVIEMEKRLCEQAPYRDMARYVWFLARKR